jgi:flagellar hook protein FlgE
MSFYTALTGLNGAQADISATSNNIANVGTTGFKRSRAEFGDIFATSPLQNASSSIGSGTILKGISQQFTQGNIASSLNALDLAISGQGFFALKPSLTASQTVYTRNGSLSVDNDRYVVDSAGQYLMVYPVNQDGSVTAKDIQSAQPLQLPVTAGEPRATSNIALGVNVPADAPVIDKPFSINDPTSYTNSTSITIFDDLGNPTIATMYFIKTKNASVDDPTNRYDTRLVINGQTIEPDLVPAVSNDGTQIFIDRFGNQTTKVPDDNYFIEGKGSPLYRIDTLERTVPSQPAAVKSDSSAFDFGEEGDRFVEIVTDPVYFGSTYEAQVASGASNPTRETFWGRDFLLVNVDNSDQPVSIDIRPGRYNAAQLAAEVERAINDAYGDDKKIQIRQTIDSNISINMVRMTADGTPESLTDPISINLLEPSYVSEASGAVDEALVQATPNLTREEFLAHAQARIVSELDDYIYSGETLSQARIDELNVGGTLFARAHGDALSPVPDSTMVVAIDHAVYDPADPATPKAAERFLVYSNADRRPEITIYDNLLSGEASWLPNSSNILKIMVDPTKIPADEVVVRFADVDSNSPYAVLNGREIPILERDDDYVTLDLSGIAVSANPPATLSFFASVSEQLEAFFEGSQNEVQGVYQPFSTGRIIVRETGTAANRDVNTPLSDVLSFSDQTTGAAAALGLVTAEERISWVNEIDPPIEIDYDAVNQRLEFTANRAVLGAGTAGFNSFQVYTTGVETGTNGLGIPALGNSNEGLIRGGEVLSTSTFLANGQDIQLNDNRYGVRVVYNSDSQSFTIRSGTTGEAISENGAIGVDAAQRASNVQVGRRLIAASERATADVAFESVPPSLSTIGAGSNALLGFGQAVQDAVVFTAPKGLASEPAQAIGDAAQAPLTDVFRLSGDNNENIFNISVNGISGVVAIPPGNYVGSTLAQALQERINQIVDPSTGRTVGGVTVRYSSSGNNFVFSTGTTGDISTIKVRGAARLGLDDVPLGVGSVPEIYNLSQALSPDGLPLFVDKDGNITTTPPDSLVEGYYPLYINEGELTFDRTGKLITPLNMVRYEDQSDGFSISLDVDFSASTQLAQPFTVLNINQDGFTSGRLDGLEIDSSGTIRANYTNGQNNPLGKIVIANFNNQNGLKQIGNATYVETAVSGAPQIGEAGADGFGTIQSGALERSNVDITEELVNLITAQRNYQASAKAIETTTSLTQTIINIRM